jgi:ribosomal protein L17
MQKANMEQRMALTQNLVNHLINENAIQTERVRDIMLTVDRGEFWTGVD